VEEGGVKVDWQKEGVKVHGGASLLGLKIQIFLLVLLPLTQDTRIHRRVVAEKQEQKQGLPKNQFG